MTRTAPFTANAPAPAPFMSQAIKCNGFIYSTGSLGLDPATGKFVEGTIYDRAKQAIENLGAILESAGSGLDKVIKVNVFLSKMEYMPEFNRAYAEIFVWDPKPARTGVCVAELPMGAEMEVECVAEA